LVSIVDDDVPPPLAGTRPPPLAVPDASLNSPVYTAPAVATPPPPPIKLKLKLSKVASSAVLDTISSPLAREIPPATPSPPPPPPVPATPLPPSLAPVTPLPPDTPVTPVVKTETVVSSGIDGATRKLLHRVLRKLSRHADAFPFMRPVDVILDGCPTYYDVIKQPMDLGTVKRKLEGGEYATAEQFEADVRLMLANCYAFNPPGTPVHLMGESVERAFDSEWSKCGISADKTAPAVPLTPKATTPKAATTPKISKITAAKRKSFQSTSSSAALLAHSPQVPVPALESASSKRPKTGDAKPSSRDLDDPDAIMEYLDENQTKKS
ncbi:hypothetical protein H4S07_007151, partial [Coemansia furcata]